MSWDWNAHEGRSRRLTPADAALMLLLTLIAATMSFYDLGNRTGAQTFWRPAVVGEGFVVDFGEVRHIDRLNLYEGPDARGKTKIEYSVDGQTWSPYLEVEHQTNRVFTWKLEDKPADARYFRFTAQRLGFRLYEAAFFDKNAPEAPLAVADIRPVGSQGADSEGGGDAVFDEQEEAPYRPDYRNSMYFDEIYHGRTAYEFVEGMQPYENTHPHLGKWLLSWGIEWFGMTPFGWRFMAAACGTLMVPIFYLTLKGMFGRTRYACLGTLLLVLEGFRLVHSRMANVDVFGVTFTIVMFYAMYKYGETRWRGGGFARSFRYLALSGLFFGLAASVKWNYLYGGAGLAILFFASLYRRWRESRDEWNSRFPRRAMLTLLACLLLFVAVPGTIYSVSFIPFYKSTQADDGLRDLWQTQKNMYNYHKGVKEVHPYSSKWYTWPVMARPVWYYGGKDLDKGDAQSIAAIGNPAVWWGGLAALLGTWWIGLWRRDRVAWTIFVAFLSLYVPWMVAPRSITFLYHYFPMVPLLICSLVWMFRWAEDNFRTGYRATSLFVGAAAVLFVWFYPVYTGITISRAWMNDMLRWLPSWGF